MMSYAEHWQLSHSPSQWTPPPDFCTTRRQHLPGLCRAAARAGALWSATATPEAAAAAAYAAATVCLATAAAAVAHATAGAHTLPVVLLVDGAF